MARLGEEVGEEVALLLDVLESIVLRGRLQGRNKLIQHRHRIVLKKLIQGSREHRPAERGGDWYRRASQAEPEE